MTVPEASPWSEGTARWQELFFCFLVATAAAWLTTLLWHPLGRAFAEDYIDLAKAMFSTGSFESLHRPPDYVAFLILVTGMTFFSGEGVDRRTWFGKTITTVPYVLFASTLIAFVAVFF